MRNTIRFILAGRVEEVQDCRPTDTVLDYLRERKHLTGTKEGCAEGDCGACTVVVADKQGSRLRYRAMNACILFLPALDGKQLITVEDLRQPDGSLHPVQQALVEQHGSQCGFCTPGFVMSLFAGFHDPDLAAPTRQAIDTCLAGNLCRCTGYQPIINAAHQALQGVRTDHFSAQEQAVIEQLESLQSGEMLAMNRSGQRYFAPTRLHELCTLLTDYPDATMIAGATDVGLWVTKKLQLPETLVDVGTVEELNHLVKDDTAGQLEIGAAVTYSAARQLLLEVYPELEELINRLGALQVRNAGTIGGNIANGSPIGDMPPALIALDARLVLASAQGERMIDLQDFFIDYGKQDLRPGECVARIHLPLRAEPFEFRTYKLSKRIEQDISAVCAAFFARIRDGRVEQIRIAYGGMAATPKRADHCENALIGNSWNADNIRDAMVAMRDDFSPITDMRAGAGYRMQAAENLLMRFFLETSGSDFPVRLEAYPLQTQEVKTQ